MQSVNDLATVNDLLQADGYLRHFTPAQVEEMAQEFAAGEPFPHLVLRDCLKLSPPELLPHFPSPDWDGWHRFTDPYQHQKMACGQIERIPPLLQAIIQEMSSPRFLKLVESITGLKKLMPDPYLKGGGLHCSGTGGKLEPHIDFHFYHELGLFRRVNVLLYLNPDWDESCGGTFGLWHKGEELPVKTVAPQWGTLVMFCTNNESVHGFAAPVNGDRYRRSIALYYYTSEEAEAFSGDGTTYWQQHGKLQGLRRFRLFAYKAALYGSRIFSMIAHRVNPHVRH